MKNSTEPIWEGSATVVRVTPPDYSTLPAGADFSTIKADVTLRCDAFGDIHFTIDRTRIAEFEQMAFERKSIPVRIG